MAVLGQLRGSGMQHRLTPDAVDTDRVGALVAESWRRALEA
ncbi:hypothetical protein [Actinomycetospora cinnamomea]|uniref:TetR family transcriptional regulator n=1 Tax=Actinomycetospora cinnamomea TaxID=663609 RepID=A0A2U1FR68_9PSEU|nr:hypothetical protein [Actinomycetospora cinnamomea]PVZ14612.1 hypothetical protein C8D89_101479 [Actinomycetospora cinnamomea]